MKLIYSLAILKLVFSIYMEVWELDLNMLNKKWSNQDYFKWKEEDIHVSSLYHYRQAPWIKEMCLYLTWEIIFIIGLVSNVMNLKK